MNKLNSFLQYLTQVGGLIPMSNIIFELPPLPYYVTIGQTTYEAGNQHPNRRNIGIFDLLIVTEGCLYIGEDDKHWEVGPGQSLLLLPDRYHYSTGPCQMETAFYWIHFDYSGTYRESSEEDYSLPIRHAWSNPYKLKLPQYTILSNFPRIERLLLQLLEYSNQSGSISYWKTQQHFMELIRCVVGEGATTPSTKSVLNLAEQTEAYLRSHFQENLNNETLSRALNYHPNYIVRCMKDIYKCTPMEYLLQYRIEQAKLLLIKTEWSVADIGAHVGFQYTPYFSSCFKRHTGLNPLAFRKLHAD